jgi:hypothetical protein
MSVIRVVGEEIGQSIVPGAIPLLSLDIWTHICTTITASIGGHPLRTKLLRHLKRKLLRKPNRRATIVGEREDGGEMTDQSGSGGPNNDAP